MLKSMISSDNLQFTLFYFDKKYVTFICKMSSDSDDYLPDEVRPSNEEEDEGETFEYSSVSVKDFYYIYHKGKPSLQPSPFAKINENEHFPEGIWKSGKKVYDMNDPELCLKPAKDQTDVILRFESHFESGNLAEAYYMGNYTYHCVLEYDRNPSKSCQWFYFQIKNARKDRTYKFYITGFHKSKGLYTSGAKIFWYSEKRALRDNISWTRGGDNYSYGILPGQKSKKKRSTVSFEIEFPDNNDIIYLCYALPYTYSDLLRDVGNWTKESECVKSEVLCETAGGREIPLLTVTDEKSETKSEDKPYVFVTARIHPGESNASFLMRGFMSFLLSNEKEADNLRKKYIFKIVPMLNIDGVIEGFYRVSLSGNDLNRIWSCPDAILHPDILNTKKLFAKLAAEREVKMYLDFHGHSRLHGTFAFGCPNEGTDIEDCEKIYPRIVSYLCDAFSWQNCVFSYPEDRKFAGRIVVRTEMNVVQSFTVETSFGGILAGPRAGYLYDQAIWEELGSECCHALDIFLNGDKEDLYQVAKNDISFANPPRPKMKMDSDNVRKEAIIETECNEKVPLLQKEIPKNPYDKKKCTRFFEVDPNTISSNEPEKINTQFYSFNSEISHLF